MSKNYRIHQQLAPLFNLCEFNCPSEVQKMIIQWFFNKLDDVDSQIEETTYLLLHRPKLIGNTILNFADRNPYLLSIFLTRNPSCIIKNWCGLTVIHSILRHKESNNFRFLNLASALDVPAIEMILSTQVKTNDATNPCDGNGMTHFHVACMANHTEAVEFFLNNNVPIDQAISSGSPYFGGFTPLHLAIRCCNLNVIKVLLDRGANIYLENGERMTAVHMIIQNILKFATDISLGCFGESDEQKKLTTETTANQLVRIISEDKTKGTDNLHLIPYVQMAFLMIDKSMAGKLLEGESINQPIVSESMLWRGFTALHFATYINYETVLALIKKGADLLAEDANGITPLDMFIEKYTVDDVVSILALNPAWKKITFARNRIELLDLVSAMKTQETFTQFFDKFFTATRISIPISSPLWPGFTAMHLSVLFSRRLRNGHLCTQMIHYLHSKNPKMILAQDSHGRTPLHLAFRHLSKMSRMVIDLLFMLFRSVVTSDLVDDENLSLLHVACAQDDEGLVEKLLLVSNNVSPTYKGKSVNNCIESGWTPMHVAVAKNNASVINTLLRYGADVHDKDVHGVDSLKPEPAKPVNEFERWLPYFDSKNLEVLQVLKNDTSLCEQAEAEIGLTKLHLACLLNDLEWLKSLLTEDIDVNKQMSLDLPRWAGYTPLHASIAEPDAVSLLLKNGADVTICNANQETPIHMIFNLYIYNSHFSPKYDSKYFETIISMLRCQKDFRVNPTCQQGISHFHIACNVSDTAIVKKFLVRCKFDIDLPIDFFILGKMEFMAGFSPLHMAVVSNEDCIPPTRQLETVDLLIRHGADLNFQNSLGNTPLHIVNRYEIIERIVRTGADINIINSNGCTPLGHLLNERRYPLKHLVSPSVDQIINWLRCGCLYNKFHIFSEEGYIALSVNAMESVKDLQALFKIVTINMPQAVLPDEMGRTIIHNVVSVDECFYASNIAITEYATLIEILAKSGYDIDSQDNLGRTALHLATKFENVKAISALLMAGADIDILDKNGNSALTCHWIDCICCQSNKKEKYKCNLFNTLLAHVQKLKFCGIDVHHSNKCFIDTAYSTIDEEFENEVRTIKNIQLSSDLPALESFFSETNIVANYYTMPPTKRYDIDEFFHEDSFDQFRKKYQKVAGLLNLQYRKAVVRSTLIDDAKTSLSSLANYQIPDLCSHMIFGFLSNSDLKNIIESTNNYKNQREDSPVTLQQESSLLENKKRRIR